jgi:peptidyl-prolyl cis-trans isomerase B (cyclophilin B)
MRKIKLYTILFTLVFAIILGGCNLSSNSENKTDGSKQPVEKGTPVAPIPPDSQFQSLPRLEGSATVEMKVKGGTITIEVDGTQAPITAGNFVDLVQRGVYDGLVFHRVVREPQPFVVQGGDPQGKDPKVPKQMLGTGGFIDPGTKKQRYIPLEILPKGEVNPIYSQTFQEAGIKKAPELSHLRGAVAMARSQAPDSASAQFYFTLADVTFLDGSYAVFGYVQGDGMKLVDTIQQGDRIESAKVIKGADNLKK